MPRKGTGSKTYPNRSDLRAQPIRVPDDQNTRPYGKRAELESAQRTLPVPERVPQTPLPIAGQVADLNAPSARPNEPITAGIDRGPGPGSEALMFAGHGVGRSVLAEAAMLTGDPLLLQLAARARGRR